MAHSDFLNARDAAYLCSIFLFAVFGPAVAANGRGQPGAVLASVLVAVMVCIFAYDTVQGWRRGERARLVLKGLVPLALMLLSCLLWWTGLWGVLLGHIRVG